MQIINMYRLDAMDARTEHHQRSHHAGVCRGVAALLWMSLIASVCLSVASGRTHGMSPRSAPDKRREAIQRLSRVFEIERLPQHRQHRTPSDCMTALYNRVAYSDGISRSANPFDADLVRGFPDRDTRHVMHFYFNVSYVKTTESIIEAEFHLFKLRPRHTGSGSRSTRGVHVIQVRLYQVLDVNRIYSPDGVRLLEQRRISAHRHGWEVFRVTDSLRQWVNDSNTNHGFYLTTTSLGGRHVNGSYVRFAQRSHHHNSKQPQLVVYTDESTTVRVPSHSNFSTGVDQDIAARRRSFVQSLNERERARRKRRRNYMNARTHDALTSQLAEASSTERGRRRRSTDVYQYSRRRKKSCSRHELYVDFDEIGWSGWIISPKGYNAYHCKGGCPFPLGQNQKPTNHATVQSIVHALRIGKNLETPSCVPNKLYSISLLYFDDDENVILKQYDDMVAASCGCH